MPELPDFKVSLSIKGDYFYYYIHNVHIIFLFGKPRGMKSLVRLRCRWEDIIKVRFNFIFIFRGTSSEERRKCSSGIKKVS
jgi:hypothetical protein